jgi:hypothetical protein
MPYRRLPVRVTAWDVRLFGRAAGMASAAFALAWLVTATTDEGGVAWAERVGRTLPLAPLCAAIGAAVALAPVRSRGEARALAALGRPRLEVAAGAVAGAALTALVAATLLGLVRAIDVAGFFPTATHASAWRWDGAAFVDAARGLRVAADGAPQRIGGAETASRAALPATARAAASLTTALAGIALPLLVAHALLGRAAGRRFDRVDVVSAIVATAAVAASVVAFQAAAARRAPAMLGVVPAALLLAFAIRRYRASP